MASLLRPLLVLLLPLLISTDLLAQEREALWNQVEAAREKALPRTAITHLEALIESSLAAHAHAEAVKAITLKISLEAEIAGSPPEESIESLQAAADSAIPEIQPLLRAVLAHSYWSYFQQNRWRFLQRSQTATTPSDDFKTWDLKRILLETDRQFTAALAAPESLQATPIEEFHAFLEPGSLPTTYRPTLYDFIAYEALAFYQSGEQGAIEAETSLVIQADGPIFQPVEAFLNWRPQDPGTYSPELKAIRLYQDLLRFHLDDADRTAFLDADLHRLQFAASNAVGETASTRYTDALERFIKASSEHPISAFALSLLASQRHQNGDTATAHELAQRGLSRFPQSPGGSRCHNLIQSIEQKQLELSTERVWNAPWPTLDLSYRNLTQIHFRAIPSDFAHEINQGYRRNRSDVIEALLKLQPAHAWSSPLPPTPDFKTRSESLPVPQNLPPGYYQIIASPDPDFGLAENQISLTSVWVSDLALLVGDQNMDTTRQGLVLDALSGEPIDGAQVEVWTSDNSRLFQKSQTLATDAAGRFAYPTSLNTKNVFFIARHHGHSLSNQYPVYLYPTDHNSQTHYQTTFFTDRALYRPGQTIHYKGVSHSSDQSKGANQTLNGTALTVALIDPNGQQIATQVHRTNQYGSFSGTFTAPSGGLAGRFTLRSRHTAWGEVAFNVEEYKRPKFFAELTAPAESPRLGETVQVDGKATAYNGSAIGGATVKWRVERAAQLPRWCWWWPTPASTAIAHGEATTHDDGSFSIQFPATPDLSIPEENEPMFVYQVFADVTDSSGETRSAQLSTLVGYTSLRATISNADWLTVEQPVALQIDVRSLAGEPQAAAGHLSIYQLKQPKKVQRSALQAPDRYRHFSATATSPRYDPADINTWKNGPRIARSPLEVTAEGKASFDKALAAGPYRAEFHGTDRFGKPFSAQTTFLVVDPSGSEFSAKVPHYLQTDKTSYQPGETANALWGTGYRTGRAFVEIVRERQVLRSFWTEPNRTQSSIQIPITEEDRGGVTLRLNYVRENRLYEESRLLPVPWTNKELSIKWSRFRSKLEPGQSETWKATISGPDNEQLAAEMVAALYDASLDAFKPHNWPASLGQLRSEFNYARYSFANNPIDYWQSYRNWQTNYRDPNRRYDAFPEWIFRYLNFEEVYELSFPKSDAAEGTGWGAIQSLSGSRTIAAAASLEYEAELAVGGLQANFQDATPPPPPVQPDLAQVSARQNLSETAFFYPHLISDENGSVEISFTLPEALTTWRFLGFAHDAQLRAGLLTDTAVTAKDLMVEPNPPRFLREGDEVEFTVKVSNQSDTEQSGQLRLTFADAATLAPANEKLSHVQTDQAFDVPSKQSRSYSWRIKVPDGAGVLTYKVVGASDALSDGEEGFLPVLSRRILVTESLPLPIRDQGTKQFTFSKLLDSASSATLQHQSLTLQMASQPAWYAVMALPYLMEFTHECSEQLFNRYYANALAAHIANSDPKIRRVFELWKDSDALDSPLEKNQDLKSLLIEETPWLRDAQSESQARRRVGLLFEQNQMAQASRQALAKLAQRQLPDGRWPWFSGGQGSDYITLYLVSGFARLRQLGVEPEIAPALRALESLDRWMHGRYESIQKADDDPLAYVPSHYDALYLYARSFYLPDAPIAPEHEQAIAFFLHRAREHWPKVSSRQSEAQLALALHRFGDEATPLAMLRSLKERSVNDEELGMRWNDSASQAWWWYHAPIETQAYMIEAFADIARDEQAVKDLQVWLLKQKQTQDWKTTKATADAVYALLLRGQNLLASDALVQVALGDQDVVPESVEAGTGFFQKTFTAEQVQARMGEVALTKTDEGVSWGSLHWQYLEDFAKVTPHQDTPLTLEKALFVRRNSPTGPLLEPVQGPLSVGDELVVRLTLRSDRDMEFLHLKDQRASGVEPVNVLSGYRYQDGISYYESTRDAASHFFIERLAKGTYVFEYATRVQLKGTYQSGIAEIQCMYAPEFNSHSASTLIKVR